MIEPGKIKLKIDGVEYDANLDRIANNSDSIIHIDNNTKSLNLISGRDAFCKFVISSNNSELVNILRKVNNVEIEGCYRGSTQTMHIEFSDIQKIGSRIILTVISTTEQ